MIREYRMWIDGRWCGSEDHEILAVEAEVYAKIEKDKEL